MAELRNRYSLSLTVEKEFVDWKPPAVPAEVDLPDPVYFGEVLAAMDSRLDTSGLTFYMTQNLDELPSYGDDVVVVLMGDEFARVPRYFGDVRAIFKNYPVRPALTTSVLREPSWMNLWWLVAHARVWVNHRPGAREYRRRRRRGDWCAPIWRLPVGAANQVELPVKPLSERRTDLFFAGSILHRPGAISRTKERLSPKTIAREAMVREAERLAVRHPELEVELVITREFVDSIGADAVAYSRQLMDSRVSLVPRGTAPDTYRLWQSLRCGCVTVVDTVPRDPYFYDGAPVVRLSRWGQLEETVLPLLHDAERMEELHERSLEWWRTRGSAEAVGAFMADRLNGLRA